MRLLFWMVAMATLVVHASATAADVAGRWRAEFRGPGGATAAEVLDLTVKNGVVTGTFTNAVGGVGPIRDGRWDGTNLRFWVTWDKTDRLEAAGKLVGSTLELDLRTSQWNARRIFKRVAPADRAWTIPEPVAQQIAAALRDDAGQVEACTQ